MKSQVWCVTCTHTYTLTFQYACHKYKITKGQMFICALPDMMSCFIKWHNLALFGKLHPMHFCKKYSCFGYSDCIFSSLRPQFPDFGNFLMMNGLTRKWYREREKERRRRRKRREAERKKEKKEKEKMPRQEIQTKI